MPLCADEFFIADCLIRYCTLGCIPSPRGRYLLSKFYTDKRDYAKAEPFFQRGSIRVVPVIRGYWILLATNFSNFATSAANLRIPSPVFSYAIALSFSIQRNFFSSNSSLLTFADFAFSGSSLRSSGSVDSDSSFISSGLIVRQSQPASSRICPVFRKLAPMTSVL